MIPEVPWKDMIMWLGCKLIQSLYKSSRYSDFIHAGIDTKHQRNQNQSNLKTERVNILKPIVLSHFTGQGLEQVSFILSKSKPLSFKALKVPNFIWK